MKKQTQNIIHWNQAEDVNTTIDIIREEPLSIRIQGNPYAVVMRTPGEEMAHVAGFCLTEGIVDRPEDITTMAFCDGEDSNVVAVALSENRRSMIDQMLDRRGFISQTSCGICGKEVVDDLMQVVSPLEDDVRLDRQRTLDCLIRLKDHQPLRRQTAATHGAAAFDRQFSLLASAEDVGRHNAVDKTIGKMFQDGSLDQAAFICLSSRTSYELVQKAARAGIAVLLSVSRPTALAVDLAMALNMTLACMAPKDSGLLIFCGAQRLIS